MKIAVYILRMTICGARPLYGSQAYIRTFSLQRLLDSKGLLSVTGLFVHLETLSMSPSASTIEQ